jgi:hypothetical protein
MKRANRMKIECSTHGYFSCESIISAKNNPVAFQLWWSSGDADGQVATKL